MKSTPRKNKVAQALRNYTWVNNICGIIMAILMIFSDVSSLLIFAEIVALAVANLFIEALGEIIELLHDIKLNTSKNIDTLSDELPDL